MSQKVIVVTTKPEANQAEYAVKDTATGEYVAHGILIPVPLESLSPEQQAALGAARAVMGSLALVHAQANGFPDASL